MILLLKNIKSNTKACLNLACFSFLYCLAILLLVSVSACKKQYGESEKVFDTSVKQEQTSQPNLQNNAELSHKHFFHEQGEASWYGGKRFKKGKKTASGVAFDPHGYTAAHRFLPFGTKVKVTNQANNKSVEVVITDRGPHTQNRIIDVSRLAAKDLDMLSSGVAKVKVETVDCVLDSDDNPVGEFWVIVNAPFSQNSLATLKRNLKKTDEDIQVLSAISKRKRSKNTKVSIGPYSHLKEAMALTNTMHKQYKNVVVVAK
ncbi:septal ring lytic transglycosylase RlpA family protein [Desulfovibrio litoralis]|uniref:Probable endolytic peptidoglycan transglycosylase RlpA n=1 Tax=Desulfovibrio litoralis DSM 11393 TaxID=1121455 RepID=A0A1M7RVM7_9BACT|nr:septal ring lytic transglycosylase RlpA family protein [Desulfovibrio litoralis]SHN50349.1 rare lipoprotein A [Desulfovibrio litoralis DSM 11393]